MHGWGQQRFCRAAKLRDDCLLDQAIGVPWRRHDPFLAAALLDKRVEGLRDKGSVGEAIARVLDAGEPFLFGPVLRSLPVESLGCADPSLVRHKRRCR